MAASSLAPLSSSLSLLDLSDNFLDSLPLSLASLTNLTHLQLSHNLITHLDPDIFSHLPRLLSLDLAHNSLQQSLNLSLTGLQSSLAHLSLAGNSLERFPPVFQQTFSRLVVSPSDHQTGGNISQPARKPGALHLHPHSGKISR